MHAQNVEMAREEDVDEEQPRPGCLAGPQPRRSLSSSPHDRWASSNRKQTEKDALADKENLLVLKKKNARWFDKENACFT